MNADVAAGAQRGAAGVRRIGGIVTALIALGLLALLVAGGLAIAALREGEARTGLVQHSRDVENAVASLGNLVERSETARRGYLILRDPKFRVTWAMASEEMGTVGARLESLVSDNPQQTDRARRLRALAQELHYLQRIAIARIDGGQNPQALEEFRRDRSADILREIRQTDREMSAAEAELLETRSQSRRDNLTAFYAIFALCAFLVLAIIGVCIVVIRRYIGALASSSERLQRLNADLEGAVRERTMELQRANDEIQRFAYIVSHDLRSPLVNVMGFTAELEAAHEPLAKLVAAVELRAPELVTDEVRLAIDQDLPEAARFIRASTEKMDRLINAILRLSRDGRRALAHEPLVMNMVVEAAADALRHPIEDAGAEIAILPLPDIVSDRVAIEQIFSNLIENAIKYLKPGRPGRIELSGRVQDQRAVYEIADNGRGIDPKDHERVFDLFRRSGAQDRPGEGIGLAHVRSLAWRLGGSIEVESALDEGATFLLSLPLRISDQEAV